jgi:hypothetical protein
MFLWLQLTLTQNRLLSVCARLLHLDRSWCCCDRDAGRILSIAIINSHTPFTSISSHCNIWSSQLRLAIPTSHKPTTPQTVWRDADAEVVERCCCRQSTTFSSSSRPAQRSRYGCSNSWASASREPSESVILSPCFLRAHTDYTHRVSMSS